MYHNINTMEEIWKDIPGWEGYYQVSSMGQVKSVEREIPHLGSRRVLRERILSLTPDGGGYLKVRICKEGAGRVRKAHQLVAEAFLGHKPCGMEMIVHHKNLKRTDNRADNLEIVTNRENASQRKTQGTSEYVGVCWSKQAKKWGARITFGEEYVHLGLFFCECEASMAYQKALKRINAGLHPNMISFFASFLWRLRHYFFNNTPRPMRVIFAQKVIS